MKETQTKGKKKRITPLALTDFDADVSLRDAESLLPAAAKLAKDTKNGRWLVTWASPFKTIPTTSRSWTSRGGAGIKISLKMVLETAWANYERITGETCPHNLNV